MSKKPFKMKGHFLPGINQRSEGQTDMPDGRSASSAFQQSESPTKFILSKLFKRGTTKYVDKKLKKQAAKQTVNKSTDVVKTKTGDVSKNVFKGSSKYKAESNLTSQLKGAGKSKVQKVADFVAKNPKKAGALFGAGVFGVSTVVQGVKEKIRSKRKAKQEMKKPTPPPKSTGRKTYKQAYSDPKVTAKYKDKGGYKQFVKEAEDWWKTSAGQKYAKKNPQFKHRIIK